MFYMVIETFRDASEVYRRFDANGRMMPEGLNFVSSWIERDLNRCFQVMEADDPSLLAEWTRNWDDLMDFEIIPVVDSAEARRMILGGPLELR
jgi:hypothetical protein